MKDSGVGKLKKKRFDNILSRRYPEKEKKNVISGKAKGPKHVKIIIIISNRRVKDSNGLGRDNELRIYSKLEGMK